MANFKRILVYKIYNEAGVYIETLDDVVSDLSIEKTINGGDSEFTFQLDRKMDDFDENTSISFNNRVKVYLKDSYNTAGTKLVANGYIVSYKPYLKGKDEGVEVTCLSAVSKLSNDFYRTGTAAAASELGVELTSQRVDQMMEAIINHYRSTESNTMITNDFTDVEQTTDNAGVLFSFDHRFFNMKHLDALREVSKFLPRNKAAGYWFYWRINSDGDLVLKNLATTAQHTFIIGKHITDISGEKTIEGMINRVYFWNEKGTLDPDYLKLTSDDLTSQGAHDIIADYITDSKITNPNAAALLAESRVYDKKDPKVKISVTLNENYDLSSIEPGQTCQILNAKNNPYAVSSDKVLVIQTIRYEVDSATLELSEAADDFEDIVENERQRLDKEMTWFGFITQALTAAQLGPANRTWSTDIVFSATTGANAYRQVDWTAGIVYLPTSSGSDAGKRVIVAGNTGLMAAATDYYIYLDEETFNVSAVIVVAGTGVVKQGGDSLLDSSKSWTPDQYKGYIVSIGGQTKIIKSNTATVLTIEDRWTIADSTAVYAIQKMSFNVSSDKEAISSLTNIVFSNVKANANTASEAIVTVANNQNANINIDGATQIAFHSITADEVVVGTYASPAEAQDMVDTLANSLGDMAYEDLVESAKLGTTIIQGGYIITSLLTADNIVAGTLTGRTVQTGFPTGTNKVIRLSSVDTHLIEFMYGIDVIGEIECLYNPMNDLAGIGISGGGGAMFSVSGKSNMGAVEISLVNTYFGLWWSGGDETTERIVTNAKIDNDWLPYDTNIVDLGTASYRWKKLYLYDSLDLTAGGMICTANRTAYPAMILTEIGGNYDLATCRMDIVPDTDGQGSLGYNAQRWQVLYADYIYCTNQTADKHITGDLHFKDLFRIDEDENHLRFWNKKNQLIMKLSQDGDLWIKGKKIQN